MASEVEGCKGGCTKHGRQSWIDDEVGVVLRIVLEEVVGWLGASKRVTMAMPIAPVVVN